MPVYLNENQNPIIVPDVTPLNAGAMTPAMLAKLNSIGSSDAFMIAISQPADGTDFLVSIPSALQPTGSYMVTPIIGTPNIFTGISIDFSSQTSGQFRVTTDGPLPNGTILLLAIQELT